MKTLLRIRNVRRRKVLALAGPVTANCVAVLAGSLGVVALFATTAPLFAGTATCKVPNVSGKTLPGAKHVVVRAHCRVGKIRRAYSTTVRKGRVSSQRPKPGTVLPNRGKVNLVVSRGRRPS